VHRESLTRIEIDNDYLNFSAGHFTIFSATERENLHGHNFRVRCAATAPVGEDGLAFDYALLERLVKSLCAQLDERVLLPERSPYLRLEREPGLVTARFAQERIPFLERDCLTLPIRNASVEDLSAWLLDRLRACPELARADIRALEIGVSSGCGRWGSAHWASE
jgi:6-pyruvoyltetrahydropterin/6-carboxytetrahydropterin synthase